VAWATTGDPDAYLAAAGAFLRAAPAANSVALTAVEALRESGPTARDGDAPLLGWWQPTDEAVSGAVIHTPPYPLHVDAARRGPRARRDASRDHATDRGGHGRPRRDGRVRRREVLLYTDLDNPTSNRLYARLGYRPVEDRVMLSFDG
jgi:hypothetical protein